MKSSYLAIPDNGTSRVYATRNIQYELVIVKFYQVISLSRHISNPSYNRNGRVRIRIEQVHTVQVS